MSIQNEHGRAGEQMAVDYLKSKGYTILHRNYRYLKAEIDIVASKDDILAIIEVKYRSSTSLGSIAETVTKKKIKLLVMATDQLVREQNINLDVRFDIITIFKTRDIERIEHLKDAFYHF
ncbi:YraN family protein [Muriicola sp. Z0-33]|uniref:YraN family protein n=1 Tax=Muriicola sp. Z0-33 TaxID=2816957 RepID=UPI0022374A68|nr:YraN family protein [Muriicola sp. Z0-33]MCW5517796.1 YraN family protein [Muriicola sp. Z0-33]